MFKQGIKVGSYYELTMGENRKVAFGVMYGFKDGKNKDVYALMMYTKEKVFEFPITEELFQTWIKERRVREISSDEALANTL
ncbi:MAG TPA: hypothetical protein VMT57_04450 [Candidatus Thermoplasmatota archaeon]|nr:hypothetical protein [Candidatus Thermoplasmatota archaeon]